jgi:tetraacyldisaccharide 4'-kinase
MFDWGIFFQKGHAVRIISVGNLSMGGTGKTPHVEFLLQYLQEQYKTAALSRGYGRKTKGFVLADEQSNSHQIGDEPLQYYHKFNDVLVAVSESRNRGVTKLLEIQPDLQCVVLDDAFQHRYIKRDLNILLTDFHKPYHQNYVVPSGTLREFRRGYKRADIIIVTKTPVVLSPFTKRRFESEMKIKPYQKLLFSKIIYDGFIDFKTNELQPKINKVSTIVLFTGIANPYPLQDYLQNFCNEIVVLTFADHHDYTDKDIDTIHKLYMDQFTQNKILVTTEKDAQRLKVSKKKDLLYQLPIYYVPIHIAFHNGDEEVLKQSIKNIFI